MKRNPHKWFMVCLFFLCAALFTACGKGSSSFENMNDGTSSGPFSEENYEVGFQNTESFAPQEKEDLSAEKSVGAGETERKLIRTVNLTVETKAFDDLNGKLKEQVETLGGYVESLEVYNGSIYETYRSSRNASMKIRIPQDKLNVFLDTVTDLGNVTEQRESEEDITLTYVDLESHKLALETEQKRLLELLERAETMDEIIAIESRLSEIRYQIESMESQLRTYDNQVDYSTVYMDIVEVRELTPVNEKTVWERISDGFMESLRTLKNSVLEVIIWILAKLPYLVVLGIAVAIIVWLIRIQKRRSMKKRLKNQRAASDYANMQAGRQGAGVPTQNPTGQGAGVPLQNPAGQGAGARADQGIKESGTTEEK